MKGKQILGVTFNSDKLGGISLSNRTADCFRFWSPKNEKSNEGNERLQEYEKRVEHIGIRKFIGDILEDDFK